MKSSCKSKPATCGRTLSRIPVGSSTTKPPEPINAESDSPSLVHASDCATHNAPALPAGPCDCGALLRAERRYGALLYRLVCNRIVRLRTMLRSWRHRGPH